MSTRRGGTRGPRSPHTLGHRTVSGIPIASLPARTDGTALVIPAEQLGTGDSVAAVALALPAPLPSAAIAWNPSAAVTWSGTAGAMRSLTVAQDGTDPDRSWTVRAYPGWVADTNVAEQLAFPDVATIPGWNAAWSIDVDQPRTWVLELADDATADAATVGWTGNVSRRRPTRL